MGNEPVLDAVDTRVDMGPIVQIDALLVAATVATEIDNQLTGDLGHHQGPVLLFQQRQGHVDARSHPGAGDDPAVANEEAVSDHLDVRIIAL